VAVGVTVGLLVAVAVAVVVGEAVCEGTGVRIGFFVAGAWATGVLIGATAPPMRGVHAVVSMNITSHQ